MRVLAVIMCLLLACPTSLAEGVPMVEWTTPVPADYAEPESTEGDMDFSTEDIRAIQQALILLGTMPKGKDSGVYDAITEAAVMSFQKRVNALQGYDVLEVTGEMDVLSKAFLDYYVEEWGSLRDAGAQAESAPPAAEADSGADMPVIQWELPKPTRYVPDAPVTGEIADSWEDIIAAIDDGTARQRYAVGAWKALDLGEFGTVNMRLAGFELDERADGAGKAATTWIAGELLPEKQRMNERGAVAGGWTDSDLRAYLREKVYPALPEVVRSRVVSVNKTQKTRGVDETTAEELWIPDEDELFGADSLYFEFFKDIDENRVLTLNGSAYWWWMRSDSNYYGFRFVNSSGGFGSSGANNSGGVALGFCL